MLHYSCPSSLHASIAATRPTTALPSQRRSCISAVREITACRWALRCSTPCSDTFEVRNLLPPPVRICIVRAASQERRRFVAVLHDVSLLACTSELSGPSPMGLSISLFLGDAAPSDKSPAVPPGLVDLPPLGLVVKLELSSTRQTGPYLAGNSFVTLR